MALDLKQLHHLLSKDPHDPIVLSVDPVWLVGQVRHLMEHARGLEYAYHAEMCGCSGTPEKPECVNPYEPPKP